MGKKIYLSSPTMHGEEQKYIKEAFDTNWVAPLGKNVDEFEREMAEFIGVKEAAALSSGTAALHLAVKLAFADAYGYTFEKLMHGEWKGSQPQAFCSDMTFSATVNPVAYEGGRQIFIDSERDTWNMDPKALEKAFELYPECKVVIVADLYGVPAKMEEIKDICDAHGAILIEDAAEGLGASIICRDGAERRLGCFGKYNAISFNGNKIITTSGGGMLLADDAEAIAKSRFWATQSRDPAPWYQHTELGYNYRMSNIIAGIGRGQLPYLEEHLAQKIWVNNYYKEALAELPIKMNPHDAGTKPNFWLSCLTVNDDALESCGPMDILEALAADNIDSRPIWKPMHMQPVYAANDFVYVAANPVDEDVFARGICLPSDNKNTEEDMERICGIIKNCFAK